MMINIHCTDILTDDFYNLTNLLDNELNLRVGGIDNRKEYIHLNRIDNLANYYIAYYDEQPVGCTGTKKYNSYSLEIKRLYVKPTYRNTGIAKRLLNKIIYDAAKMNYESLILETGLPLFEAITLYKKLGFIIIPNYFPYQNLNQSICMKKIIGDNNATI